MSERISVDTPFGEAFSIIFHALTKGKGDDFATFGLTFYRKGDIRHINVKMYSETVTSKNVIEKGHAHCTWTEQFYPAACCMDINTLLEYIEKGEAATPAPRRKFEEIGNELSASLGVEWGKVQFFDNRMEFENKHKTILCIFTNGGFDLEVDAAMYSSERFTPAQLAAISAACQEIAANYQATQRKESV